MVITMQCINKFLCTRAFCNPMKKVAVGYIFKKAPEKHTSNEGEQYAAQRIVKAYITVIQHVNDHREIHTPNDQRVGFGEHFQVIILE